jgi:hypothetical protein
MSKRGWTVLIVVVLIAASAGALGVGRWAWDLLLKLHGR